MKTSFACLEQYSKTADWRALLWTMRHDHCVASFIARWWCLGGGQNDAYQLQINVQKLEKWLRLNQWDNIYQGDIEEKSHFVLLTIHLTEKDDRDGRWNSFNGCGCEMEYLYSRWRIFKQCGYVLLAPYALEFFKRQNNDGAKLGVNNAATDVRCSCVFSVHVERDNVQ